MSVIENPNATFAAADPPPPTPLPTQPLFQHRGVVVVVIFNPVLAANLAHNFLMLNQFVAGA